VTGSGGLIGSEAVRRLIADGYEVFGVDNDMRSYFFGPDGSTRQNTDALRERLGDKFHPRPIDIRNFQAILDLMNVAQPSIVVHCAAQPSHDWAAKEPLTDFGVNALGTLHVLEATRQQAESATVIHCSTSKVYGDTPNRLPLIKDGDRLDLPAGHRYRYGIDTTMSIDKSLHSLFGASKVAGDVVAQEYGRYFGMKVGIFRPGCLTGADHAGVELHGFLAYLGKCVARNAPYSIFGYDGLQVRCNIHAEDLVSAFLAFHKRPMQGEVYNIGGGRENACSMLEAISMFKEALDQPDWEPVYVDKPRIGDHRWWISSNADFRQDYPDWDLTRDLRWIVQEIADRHS
jgi:CDP-paratose 2-epimerase